MRSLSLNLTGPGSAFAPGYVARTVRDGFVHSYGEGANWQQSDWFKYPNSIANELVWGSQMYEMAMVVGVADAAGELCT